METHEVVRARTSDMKSEISEGPDAPSFQDSDSSDDEDEVDRASSNPEQALDEKHPDLSPGQQPRELKTDDNQVSPEGSSNPRSDIRYVLSGQPTGWAAMAETVRAYDEEKVKDTKEDIDTLLVFAGLFSAVLTAFLIESYQSLQPQTEPQMLAVLQQIALQTASYNMVNGMLNSTSQPPMDITSISTEPFTPTTAAIRINVLWFSSLIFSLITASFGMLVKQWLREYLAVENPSPQARLRIRRFRYPELVKWNVFEIAAILPLLQQIALALFFLGLCYFTSSVHESVGHTSIPLVAGWAFCFCTVTVMPMFFPRCPFKTTLLKHILQSLHMRFVKLIQAAAYLLNNLHARADYESLRDYCLRWTMSLLIFLDLHASRSDEQRAVIAERADLDILVDVDALQSNDELLGTTILESLHQIQPDWNNVVDFVLRVLGHRLPRVDLSSGEPRPLNLQTLSRPGRNAIIDILAFYSNSAVSQYVQSDQAISRWERSKETMAAFYIFFSPTRYPLPISGVNVLKEVLQYKGTDLCRILAHDCPRPEDLQEDTFHLLIQGFSNTLEDLDVNLTLSLRYFDTIMNVRFEDARQREAASGFPDPSVTFAIHGDLEQWPWRQVMPQDARTYAAWFMIFTIHRALRHAQRSVTTKNDKANSGTKSLVVRDPHKQIPSRLVDGLVGMWNISFIAKIYEFSHTLELRFRSAIEECFSSKDTTVALLKALVQLKPTLIIFTHTKWVAFPCGPWLLLEDPQQKLENFIDAVSILSTELDQYLQRSDEKTIPGPQLITPIHVLMICFVATRMVELPDALQYKDQWKGLFTTLTHLGHSTLDILPPPAVDDDPGVLRSSPSRVADSNALAEDTLQDGLQLTSHCLQRIQEEDIRATASSSTRNEDDPVSTRSAGAQEFEYEEWSEHFKMEDTVFEDDFVEMLGRMYSTMTTGQKDKDDYGQCFRLRKLRGILPSTHIEQHSREGGERQTSTTRRSTGQYSVDEKFDEDLDGLDDEDSVA